jgi:hypothetical protein
MMHKTKPTYAQFHHLGTAPINRLDAKLAWQ